MVPRISPRSAAATAASRASGSRRRSSGARIWSRIGLISPLPQSAAGGGRQAAEEPAGRAERVRDLERTVDFFAHARARAGFVGDQQDRALVAAAIEQVVDELERDAVSQAERVQ